MPKTTDAIVPFIILVSEKFNEKKPVKCKMSNPGIALEVKASAATRSDERWDRYLETILTFTPYIKVANTTSNGFTRFAVVFMGPLLSTNNILPVKAISIPMSLFAGVALLKNMAPISITKMGVRELSIPAIELSISCSAMQNKKAGKKLPNAPERKITGSFFNGISLNALAAMGNNNIPAATILNDAI